MISRRLKKKVKAQRDSGLNRIFWCKGESNYVGCFDLDLSGHCRRPWNSRPFRLWGPYLFYLEGRPEFRSRLSLSLLSATLIFSVGQVGVSLHVARSV